MGKFEEAASARENARRPMEAILQSPEELAKIAHAHRNEAERALRQLDVLRRDYPDFFKRLNEKYPKIGDTIFKIETLGRTSIMINDPNKTAALIRDYQFLSGELNHALNRTNQGMAEEQSNRYAQAGSIDDFELNPEEFTEADKQEIKALAEELWKEMFPTTYVDKFAMWMTDMDHIDQKNKWALAPANGVEMSIRSMIGLLNPETYREMVSTVGYLKDMSYEDWKDAMEMLSLAYSELSSEDKLSAVITVLSGIIFFCGGMAGVMSKINKLSCADKLKKVLYTSEMLYTASRSSQAMKPLPAMVLGKVTIDFDHPGLTNQ